MPFLYRPGKVKIYNHPLLKRRDLYIQNVQKLSPNRKSESQNLKSIVSNVSICFTPGLNIVPGLQVKFE